MAMATARAIEMIIGFAFFRFIAPPFMHAAHVQELCHNLPTCCLLLIFSALLVDIWPVQPLIRTSMAFRLQLFYTFSPRLLSFSRFNFRSRCDTSAENG